MLNNNACTGRIILLCLFLLCPPGLSAQHAAHNKKLIFGMLPSRSTVTMFNRFAPLRDYLIKELKHDIIFETAPDYDTFLERCRQRKYDLILTAPHFALLTTDTGLYEARATYQKPLSAVILVHAESKFHKLEQLARKSIATPPHQAIITMAGKYHLMESGLSGNRKSRYVLTKSHSASLYAMLSGEADAAIVSSNVARHAIKQNQPVRKISQSPDIPGMAILAAKDLPRDLRDKFGNLLINMHKNDKGRRILKKINYPGYRKATEREFESVRSYLKSSKE